MFEHFDKQGKDEAVYTIYHNESYNGFFVQLRYYDKSTGDFVHKEFTSDYGNLVGRSVGSSEALESAICEKNQPKVVKVNNYKHILEAVKDEFLPYLKSIGVDKEKIVNNLGIYFCCKVTPTFKQNLINILSYDDISEIKNRLNLLLSELEFIVE